MTRLLTRIFQEQRVFVTVAVQPGGAQSGSLVPFNTQSYAQQYPSVVPIRSPPNSQQQSQQPPQSRSDNYSWGPTHPINRLVLFFFRFRTITLNNIKLQSLTRHCKMALR